jgi:hypothetical protein
MVELDESALEAVAGGDSGDPAYDYYAAQVPSAMYTASRDSDDESVDANRMNSDGCFGRQHEVGWLSWGLDAICK